MDITSFVTKKRDRALQVGDYNSYRSQLSRQLLSLRRRLGRTTPHKAKYTAKAEITVEDVASNHEFVHYLLIQAERAWAHAMHIKSMHVQDNASKGISGPTRKHIISKLHKAFGYANQIVTLLGDRSVSNASDNAFLEAHAYALYLSGSEEFEKQATKRYEDPAVQKQAWSSCLVAFSEAHVIYTALLFSTQREVFKVVLTDTVDPSIRYAAFQSGISRTIPIPTVAKQHFRRHRTDFLSLVEKLNPNALSQEATQVAKTKDGTSTLDIPTTIKWRQHTAPIADAAIGQALAATSIASSDLSSLFASAKGSKAKGAKLSKKKANSARNLAAGYDPVLTSAQDTVDAVRRAISDLQKEGISESDQRMQDLRVSDLATNYSLVSWRVGRNRVLISGSTGDDGASFDLDSSPRHGRASNNKRANGDGEAGAAPSTTDDDEEAAAAAAVQQIHLQSSGPSKSSLLSLLRERAVLYDATLQSLDSILALRGASSSPDFLAETAQTRAYFQALKCLNLGHSHNIVDAASGAASALALFDRAGKVLFDAHPDLAAAAADEDVDMQDASKTTATADPPTLAISQSQLTTLARTLRATLLRQRGLVALRQYTAAAAATSPAAKSTTTESQSADPPLIASLDAYPAAGAVDTRNIVTYPPRLQPVPVKPIFLDLAWNYIEYPGRGGPSRNDNDVVGVTAKAAVDAGAKVAGKIAEAVGVDGDGSEQQQQQGKKKGWFGFGRG